MQAVDLIRWAMQFTDQGVANLVEDMRDAPLTRPTSRGGNHPLWAMGHLAFVEGGTTRVLTGETNPVENWAPLFGPGSEPKDDASVYPPFDEILATFRSLRARNLRLLDEIGESGLDRKPVWVPPGFESVMTTAGQTLLLTALHTMVHYGRITVARRAAGRKPLR